MIEGKFGIKATVLADSISAAGVRLITWEVEYPRIILAEANTHRMLSKNSHSSRAIPFNKMKEQLTGRPVRFGAANPGMQDKGEEHDALVMFPDEEGDLWAYLPSDAWDMAREDALAWSEAFYNAGFAKQVYNRLTEPFQMMRTVISGTERENFYWLRNHGAADPTLQELARVMLEAQDASTPVLLRPGEWHLPYVHILTSMDGSPALYYLNDADVGTTGHVPVEDAIKVSCARCAAVSFRNLDYGLPKCLEVYDRLVGDDRKHASAFEHQGTPMALTNAFTVFGFSGNWQEGTSHMDRDGNLWSGNFKGFIQYRKLIPGENYTGNGQ